MSAAPGRTLAAVDSIPELRFGVEGVSVLQPAAVPTLVFELRVAAQPAVAIRSILLNVQLQIAARRRPYDDRAQQRLVELFGTPDRWGETLKTLPWLRTTLVVPAFTESTVAELHVACTYDLEVAAARYFDALDGGSVPLDLLFSGSVFYANAAGQLQTTRIAWESDAEFELPVSTWKAAIERHFPGGAWLRLDRERFERLRDFKARRALPSWEAALDALFEAEDG